MIDREPMIRLTRLVAPGSRSPPRRPSPMTPTTTPTPGSRRTRPWPARIRASSIKSRPASAPGIATILSIDDIELAVHDPVVKGPAAAFAGQHPSAAPSLDRSPVSHGAEYLGSSIAQDLDINEEDARSLTRRLRQGIVERRPPAVLEGEVECDEVHGEVGHDGHPEAIERKGAPSRRRPKGAPGRGTLAEEEPPIFGGATATRRSAMRRASRPGMTTGAGPARPMSTRSRGPGRCCAPAVGLPEGPVSTLSRCTTSGLAARDRRAP
jgi:hypothetical protein